LLLLEPDPLCPAASSPIADHAARLLHPARHHPSPAHALHFAVYERAKESFGGNDVGYQWLPTAAAGATATLVNDAFMVPVDVIKQRLQVCIGGWRMRCQQEVNGVLWRLTQACCCLPPLRWLTRPTRAWVTASAPCCGRRAWARCTAHTGGVG
jgi:hypothetical protein